MAGIPQLLRVHIPPEGKGVKAIEQTRASLIKELSLACGGIAQEGVGAPEVDHIHPVFAQDLDHLVGEIQEVNRLIIQKSEVDIALRICLARALGPEKQYELQRLVLEKRDQLRLDFIDGEDSCAHNGLIFS